MDSRPQKKDKRGKKGEKVFYSTRMMRGKEPPWKTETLSSFSPTNLKRVHHLGPISFSLTLARSRILYFHSTAKDTRRVTATRINRTSPQCFYAAPFLSRGLFTIPFSSPLFSHVKHPASTKVIGDRVSPTERASRTHNATAGDRNSRRDTRWFPGQFPSHITSCLRGVTTG